MVSDDDEKRLRSSALKTAESILVAGQRAERDLMIAKEALAKKSDELRQQREWFAVTLSSIGDAVITTDTDARVTFLNPVAEGMTGWSAAEASGRPLEEVFRIVNEDSQQTIENPIRKVLKDGQIVSLANHTALMSRNGDQIAIEDSAAPIQAQRERSRAR